MSGLKQKISTRVYKALTRISPRLNTQLRYQRAAGRFADLKNPQSFSEKLLWLKLNRYADDPLVRRCADKLRVRDYVVEKGLGHLLNPLLAVYDRTEDIRWEELPRQFVLKWNFGCGANLLCPDREKLDTQKAAAQLRTWGKNEFWQEFAELQYRVDKKVLLCERFLEVPAGEELLDYKFYCFHGKAKAVLVIARPTEGEKAAVFMSPEWELLSDIPSRYRESLVPARPERLQEMIEAAERLAEPFPFVRVDFYQHEGRPIFGEMTFTPAACILPSETPIDGKPMGDLLCIDCLKEGH